MPARTEIAAADVADHAAVRSPWFVYLAAALFAAIAPLALLIDLPLVTLIRRGALPSDAHHALELMEVFAHGLGVAVIAAAVFLLDNKHRWAFARVMAAALGSGMIAQAAKFIVARNRPRFIELPETVWGTFGGWLPSATAVDWEAIFDSATRSFPSGHAATAAGLAVALCWLYPRGRALFVVLAASAMIERVASQWHYPSDIFGGAAVGLLFAGACIDRRLLGRWFDALERR